MPFIHVHARAGRDLEGKKQMAEAIVKAASETSGIPLQAFTVVYEDIVPGNEPDSDAHLDNLIIKGGELVK